MLSLFSFTNQNPNLDKRGRLHDRGDRQPNRHSLRHEHLCSLRIQGEPVVDVMDAVAVELKAIEYRKKNAS
jgi:hypothetical protein